VKLLIMVFCLILVPSASASQADSPEQSPTPSIQGKVLQEPGGQPIRKANVQLNGRREPGTKEHSAVTDAEGQFTIDDVQPGQYVVVVERPGFVQSNPGGRVTKISVKEGSGKNDLTVHMQAAAVITGKIVDQDGDAMGSVSVSATRVGPVGEERGPHNSGGGATNDLGEFRISDLRAGRYKIIASPPPGSLAPKESSKGKEQSIYLSTYYPGVLDEGQTVTVEVQAGVETRINFGLLTGRAYRVSGTVTGVPGASGVAEILLQANGSGGGSENTQEISEGGRFEFTNVLPGSYVPRLMLMTFEGGQPGIQILRLGQTIEVSNANVEGLRLQPEVGGQVRGKFRLDTGQKFDWTQLTVTLIPVEERNAGITWEGGMQIPTVSGVNADGSFELKNVPGGNYQPLVGAKSNKFLDCFTKSVNLDGRDVTDTGFAVLPQTYLDVVVSANGASIAGTVVDSKGQPVANATVVDVPSGEHRGRLDFYQRDMTDDDGHFSLRGLNPGKYTVLAFEELQEDVRAPEFRKTYADHGESVELDEGARKSVVLRLITPDAEAP
jgi:hypothetical protein